VNGSSNSAAAHASSSAEKLVELAQHAADALRAATVRGPIGLEILEQRQITSRRQRTGSCAASAGEMIRLI